ncbi:butyrophilin subfamily 1 member A1-like [Ursus maritimus]|uniref:Butyrophilin subfamily 1 member A1-like n=1 Tax=Ursus maritimus TaxID=29073 RepID=A0A8M1H4R1_URSMA|nr:butyrophilin subfamily 1 member A1-like [Ursus maritimus]
MFAILRDGTSCLFFTLFQMNSKKILPGGNLFTWLVSDCPDVLGSLVPPKSRYLLSLFQSGTEDPFLGQKWKLVGGRTLFHELSLIWATVSQPMLGYLGVMVVPGACHASWVYSNADLPPILLGFQPSVQLVLSQNLESKSQLLCDFSKIGGRRNSSPVSYFEFFLMILLLPSWLLTSPQLAVMIQMLAPSIVVGSDGAVKVTKSAVSVTLDPKSAHPSLAVSDEKTSVTLKDTAEDPTILFSILGRESITSGRCYWVVEIRNGDKSEWSLGVCRGDVDRKSLHLESPEKGIWAVGRYLENYYACSIFRILLSCRQVPHRVGVFLDLKEGDVSFYNMTDDSHMFSFPLASSSGTLFPYFMLRSGDVSLTICSVMGGPAEILVPLNNPPSSLEEPVSLSGVGLKSVSDVDGALPGAESPLLPCSPEAMSP